MKLYQAIAQNARLLESAACFDHAVNSKYLREQAEERQDRIEALFPHGSGFDAGTKLISANDQKIVFETEFHHMDGNGFYDGWTSHRVTAKASLMCGFTVDVSGKNRNDIKDYVADVFNCLLNSDFEWLKGA